MKNIDIFLINSIPEKIEYVNFIRAALRMPFAFYHDLKNSYTYLILERGANPLQFLSAIPGLSIKKSDLILNDYEFKMIVPYFENTFDEKKQPEQKFLDAYKILKNVDASFFIIFIPSEIKHTVLIKENIEDRLSKIETRTTRQQNSKDFNNPFNVSIQTELFYGSDEKRVLLSILEMLNEILISNGTSYMVSILFNKKLEQISSYLKSKLLIIDESTFTLNQNIDFFEYFKKIDSIPFSEKKAALTLAFSDYIPVKPLIQTYLNETNGDILIGTYLENSITDGNKKIFIERNAFNLGVLITGVPGTGKTSSSMSILRQIPKILYSLQNVIRCCRVFISKYELGFFYTNKHS